MIKRIVQNFRDTLLYGKSQLPKIKSIGTGCIVNRSVKLVAPESISIGDYVRIGPNCHLDGTGGVTIGDGTIFGPHVSVLTASHNYDQSELVPYDHTEILRSVTIGRAVWCGRQTLIVPGVTIGDGAVIAAGAVVTRNVAAGSVVGGNPAKEIKVRGDIEAMIKAIEESRFYLKTKGIASRQNRIEHTAKKSVEKK